MAEEKSLLLAQLRCGGCAITNVAILHCPRRKSAYATRRPSCPSDTAVAAMAVDFLPSRLLLSIQQIMR